MNVEESALNQGNQPPVDLNKGHRERLRNRFVKSGSKAFAEHELLELLLTFSIPRKDTKPTAKELLHRFKNLTSVLNAPKEELMKTKQISENSACLLHLVKELHIHIMETSLRTKKSISNQEELVSYFKEFLKMQPIEFFGVVALDNRNQIKSDDILKLQHGTVDRAPVYVRDIIEYALKLKATRVIIVHNHPTGNPNPSSADIEITYVIRDALKLIDIELLDHIIIAGDNPPYSFQAHGKL